MDGAANATDLGRARGGGILRDVRGIGLGLCQILGKLFQPTG